LIIFLREEFINILIIIKYTNHFYNGYSFGEKGIRNYKVLTEDHETILSKEYLKRLGKYMFTNIKSIYKFVRGTR
jgi:hypothetical protein